MTIRRLIQVAAVTAVAVFIMAASASASTITYNTNAAGTLFVGGGLVLNSSGGSAATLTFTPNSNTATGVPSNLNFGDFLLVCTTCGTQASGLGTHFNSFTFDLIITDVTDSATGEFVGTSSGGSVWSDVSQVSISWLPLQLGPGTSNALSGSFGTTYFTISTPTLIVAPNSGTPPGDTTVQGGVSSSAIPEPATMAMAGGALIALAALARKRRK